MIPSHTIQSAFVGGELSPLMLGRTNDPRFQLSGQTVENFLVRHQGPIVRRRGTQKVLESDCPFARLVNFQFSASESSMTQWGCSEIIVDLFPPYSRELPVDVTFYQYDGPFVFPEHLFNKNGFFFRAISVAGENKAKNAEVPHSPGLYACEIGDGVTSFINGVVYTQFYGSYQMLILDPTPLDALLEPAGAEPLACMVTRWGMLAPGVFYEADGFGDAVEVRSLTWEGLLDEIRSVDGYCLFEQEWAGAHYATVDGVTVLIYQERHKTINEMGTGSFSGGVLSYIWCPGYEVVTTYSGFVALREVQTTVARTGEDARTQHIVSYDAGTRTYTGNASRAVFRIKPDAGSTALVGQFVFHVVPGTGAAYDLPLDFDIVPVYPSTEFSLEYPIIVDATVYLTSWSFSDQPSVYDDFESYIPSREYDYLPATGVWRFDASFMAPAPNSGARDDFETAPSDFPTVSSVVTGLWWTAAGQLSSVDPETCYDDLESETTGAIYAFFHGTGWVSSGTTIIAYEEYDYVDDDMETYSSGSITSLPDGNNSYATWAGDGAII